MEKRNNDLSAYFSKLPYRLSHMKSALDYLLADKATGKLTLQIIAKKKQGKTRRSRVRETNAKQHFRVWNIEPVTVDSAALP